MIRTYRAASMHEALEMAKAELGSEALIVEARRVPAADRRADDREGQIEITAMLAGADRTAGSSGAMPQIELLASRYQFSGAAAPGRRAPQSRGISGIAETMRACGLRGQLLRELAEEWTTTPRQERRHTLARILGRAFRFDDIVRSRDGRLVAALVGPTGVGKTTTIAKLAAVLSTVGGLRVALVTADSYRLGAVEQLRGFADIMDLICFAVRDRDDLRIALEASADADIVLIDTPGSNPFNSEMLKELRQLLGPREPIACLLTLSMTGDFADLLHAAERFALLNPTGLIVTKIDETTRPAVVVGLVQQLGLPLHYVCAGPTVPDDLTQASAHLLADLLVQGVERLERQRARQLLRA